MDFNYIVFDICRWIIWIITFILFFVFGSILSKPDDFNDDNKIAITSLYIIFNIGSFICLIILMFRPSPSSEITSDIVFSHIVYIIPTLISLIFFIVEMANGKIINILNKKPISPPLTAPAQQLARSFQLPQTFQLPPTKPPMFQFPDLNGVYSELTRLKDQFNIAKE